VLAVSVTLLGWWRPVLFESERAGPRWFWLSPALTLAIAILFLLVGDFPEIGRMLLLLLVGSLGVTGGEFGVEGSIVAVVSWTAVALAAYAYFRRAQAAPSSTATSATADEQSQPQPD
jgi:hypothetical protein